MLWALGWGQPRRPSTADDCFVRSQPPHGPDLFVDHSRLRSLPRVRSARLGSVLPEPPRARSVFAVQPTSV